MGNRLVSAKVNILGGVFSESISFKPGLNIISGENGTLKTRLFKAMSGAKDINNNPANQGPMHHRPQVEDEAILELTEKGDPFSAMFISPKRNAERRNIENIIAVLSNQSPGMRENQDLFRLIDDSTYKTYPSLGELFYKRHTELSNSGGDRVQYMNQVRDEFNAEIQKVFSDYELQATWNPEKGQPQIELHKKGKALVPIDQVSLGEQEMLSLILNLYVNRDKYDAILVDEPEIHLNWHLEEKLFRYLDQYCEEYDKQMVVISHSRAIFHEQLLPKTQFLYWDNCKIKVSSKPSVEIKKILAGELLEIVKVGTLDKTTFFVEDRAHEHIVQELATTLGADIIISRCGTSSNVKSLYQYAKSSGAWPNAVFMLDGDNEGNPYPGDAQFIHLRKYCIQNYLMDFIVMGAVLGKSEKELQQLIYDAIQVKKSAVLQKNKYLEFLLQKLEPSDITVEHLAHFDASDILPVILKPFKTDESEYVEKYIKEANAKGVLDKVFPAELISAIIKTIQKK